MRSRVILADLRRRAAALALALVLATGLLGVGAGSALADAAKADPAAPAATAAAPAAEDAKEPAPLTVSDVVGLCRDELGVTATTPLIVMSSEGRVWVYEAPDPAAKAKAADKAEAKAKAPALKDGEYVGTFASDGHEAEATVTIKDGKVTSVVLDKGSRGSGLGTFKVSRLVEAIVAAQGTEGVDKELVSAASFGKAIVGAVDACLAQARGDLDAASQAVQRAASLAKKLAGAKLADGGVYADEGGMLDIDAYDGEQADPAAEPKAHAFVAATWVVADESDQAVGGVVVKAEKKATEGKAAEGKATDEKAADTKKAGADGWWFSKDFWASLEKPALPERVWGEVPTLADGTPLCDPSVWVVDQAAYDEQVWVEDWPAWTEEVWVVDAAAWDEQKWIMEKPGWTEEKWVVDTPAHWENVWIVDGYHELYVWRDPVLGDEFPSQDVADYEYQSWIFVYWALMETDNYDIGEQAYRCTECGNVYYTMDRRDLAEAHVLWHANQHRAVKTYVCDVEDGHWENVWVEDAGHTEYISHDPQGHLEIIHHDEVGHVEYVPHEAVGHWEAVHHDEVGHSVTDKEATGHWETVHHDEVGHWE